MDAHPADAKELSPKRLVDSSPPVSDFFFLVVIHQSLS